MSPSDSHSGARSTVEDALTLLLLDPEQEEAKLDVARLDFGEIPDELR
ncbi:hypothetical protein ACTXMW_15565 [Brachybacterium paraconglomeratum]|nr:hypothetical protein [Brachybacterium sp. HMSC06H03]